MHWFSLIVINSLTILCLFLVTKFNQTMRVWFQKLIYEIFGQNNIQTHGTSTAGTYACGYTCTDAHGIMCIGKYTHRITIKDSRRSTYTHSCGSTWKDVYTEITVVFTASTRVQGSMCSYISTKFIVLHVGTSTDILQERQ